MLIHLSPKNGIPIYLQIVSQVKYLVASGRLRPSDEVPPIRALAEKLLINPNTVARAYRELEQAGILIKRQGAGTYVSETGTPLAWAERIKLLTERIDGLLAEAHQLDVPTEQVLALIKERDRLIAASPNKETGNAGAE
ncbi:MAG: GntR family transcriptional regulator [Candidatus Hydrogenedentes bacterium]|nr:GntR family transcriptional regulator [Candidatus Hydrogenedentota bacterium]